MPLKRRPAGKCFITKLAHVLSNRSNNFVRPLMDFPCAHEPERLRTFRTSVVATLIVQGIVVPIQDPLAAQIFLTDDTIEYFFATLGMLLALVSCVA